MLIPSIRIIVGEHTAPGVRPRQVELCHTEAHALMSFSQLAQSGWSTQPDRMHVGRRSGRGLPEKKQKHSLRHEYESQWTARHGTGLQCCSPSCSFLEVPCSIRAITHKRTIMTWRVDPHQWDKGQGYHSVTGVNICVAGGIANSCQKQPANHTRSAALHGLSPGQVGERT